MTHHIILGTAGHIDHGKSSLVQRLTGTNPDRLPEEKARGVTIDLGFAHLSLSNESESYEIGIVDVPGHADFVNNMVAGVGTLDIALFIIAADDGWMPQSEEHLHILNYLGISNIIIALTKSDLCEDVPFSVEMLRDELQETSIAEAPIIPVSSVTGEGIDTLKQTLSQLLSTHQQPQDNLKPRLEIDRVFSPKGTGTVVTGTLTGSNIKVGDSLIAQPLGISAKVRYIQSHNQPLDQASSGMRTALNLPDLPIDAPGKPGAKRGLTLTTDNSGSPSNTVDVHLHRLARSIPGIKPRALKHMETVVIHHGSARCKARVILHDRSQLNPGEDCLAQLRMDNELFIFTGDRIVLRDGSQQSTLAGGTVLDALPARQGFRTASREAFLKDRAAQPDNPAVYIRTSILRDRVLEADRVLTNHPFHPDLIQQTCEHLVAEGSILRHGNLLIHGKWWKKLQDAAEQAIRNWHKQHPDLPHMPIEELHKVIDSPSSTAALIITTLEAKGYQVSGPGIAHQNHRLTLPDDIKKIASAIVSQLNQCGLNPPNKSDLIHTAAEDQAIKFLIRSDQIVELDAKIVISTNALNKAIESVMKFISIHGQATASDLRQHLQSTRKIVMPLLEHMDKLGVTQRNENFRVLK
ncbi:MAG: selenocysteine-specific translation elongation factor [Akkermansiaceae bacterium]